MHELTAQHHQGLSLIGVRQDRHDDAAEFGSLIVRLARRWSDCELRCRLRIADRLAAVVAEVSEEGLGADDPIGHADEQPATGLSAKLADFFSPEHLEQAAAAHPTLSFTAEGQRLRERRLAAKLTQVELANQVACSQSQISKAESGLIRLDDVTMSCIDRVLAGGAEHPPSSTARCRRHA